MQIMRSLRRGLGIVARSTSSRTIRCIICVNSVVVPLLRLKAMNVASADVEIGKSALLNDMAILVEHKMYNLSD